MSTIDIVFLESQEWVCAHEEGAEEKAAIVEAAHVSQQVPEVVSDTWLYLEQARQFELHFKLK